MELYMEYTIKFTEPELDLILKALGELPARMSLQMINKLHNEVIAQNQKQEIQEEKKADIKQVK